MYTNTSRVSNNVIRSFYSLFNEIKFIHTVTTLQGQFK